MSNDCRCGECREFDDCMSRREAALPPVRSEPLLAACDIIRRLVDKVNEDNEYDEHQCPNDKPCGVCKLVAEAKAFITANTAVSGPKPSAGLGTQDGLVGGTMEDKR